MRSRLPLAAMAAVAALPSFSRAEPVNPQLLEYIQQRVTEFDRIEPERRERLAQLADYAHQYYESGKPIRMTFICTHNSRRSHLSQLWAAAAATHYGIGGFESYSGGTEATAFNPRAVAALRRAGFSIPAQEPAENPRYEVSFSAEDEPQVCFSKTYDDPSNPQEGFCAVMTCSHADKSCPAVLGAERRVAIPYADPKVSDNTPTEAATYDERCAQIAREMLYAFSLLAPMTGE